MSDIANSVSLNQSGSTIYATGASGYDYSALIDAEYELALSEADSLEAEVSESELVVAAYEEMQGYLQAMEDSVAVLTNSSSLSDENVFDDMAAYLGSDSSTATDVLLGVTVNEGTASGTYQIEVLQVASAQKISSNSVASSTSALGYTGVFTLGTVSGSAEVAVDATTSLEDIKNSINTSTGTSGVSASILKIADNDFVLILNTEATNETISFSSVSGDDVMQNLGVVDNTGTALNILQDAQPAMLTIDGIAVERNSNSVDDLIEGVSINLYASEVGTTVTVEIAEDLSAIKEAVNEFVTAYNNYRNFAIIQQSTTATGGSSEEAVLFGDHLLRSANDDVYSLLNNTVISDGDVLSLASLGISFKYDNTLEIDETVLDNLLLSDPNKIQDFFSFNATTSSSDLGFYSHDGIYDEMEFTLDITVDGLGNVDAGVGGDTSLFTVKNSAISGAEGSIYEGLSFVFTGNASTSVDVFVAQGIADQLRYSLSSWADGSNSILGDRIDSMGGSISDKNEEILEIESDAETYRDQLINYYAEIEAKILESNLLIDQLEALNAD